MYCPASLAACTTRDLRPLVEIINRSVENGRADRINIRAPNDRAILLSCLELIIISYVR